MNIVLYSIPAFILLIIIEILVDVSRKTGYYRVNDAISSLSMGIMSQTAAFFTRFVRLAIFGYIAGSLIPYSIPAEYFDMTTPLGLAGFFAVLVAYDFCYYWKHRFGHEYTWFWAAHVAHHQSEEYNLTTALRQASMGWMLGWVFYLPIVLAGVPAEVFISAGAINLVYQFWVHTRHINKLGIFDYIFVTPSNHRVHHGQNELYLDKNYAGIFILWDRMFGTFQEERDEEPVVYGITSPLKNFSPFWANLHIYAMMFQDAWRTRKWSDKLKVFFSRTGDRPADVLEKYPVKKTDLKKFQKFDPQVPMRVTWYGIFQFMVVLGATVLVLFMGKNWNLTMQIVAIVPIWMAMYSIGMLNEGRPGAVGFEALRIVIQLGAGVALYYAGYLTFAAADTFVTVLMDYSLVSVVWLVFLNGRSRSRRLEPAAAA